MIDYKYDSLEEIVIKLHNLAAIIEKEIGVGNLSQDVRKTADRLSEVINDVH